MYYKLWETDRKGNVHMLVYLVLNSKVVIIEHKIRRIS